MTGGPGPSPVMVCPRHPDRESYVLCQRCSRPACPQCQVPAPVGFQCVDCVRDGATSMRAARTTAGALVRRSAPVVSYGFIGLCVLLYLAQRAIPTLTGDLAFVPLLAHEQPWRYLTNALLHDTSTLLPIHLGMNMYCVWALGPALERELGRLRFLILTVLTALGGAVAYQVIVGSASMTMVVGASSVVFGYFGALLAAGRKMGLQVGGLVTVIVINAVIGFAYPGIAWQGHLGGLLTGAAAGLVLVTGSRANRGTVQIVGLGAIAVVLIGLALLT